MATRETGDGGKTGTPDSEFLVVSAFLSSVPCCCRVGSAMLARRPFSNCHGDVRAIMQRGALGEVRVLIGRRKRGITKQYRKKKTAFDCSRVGEI